MKHKLNDSTRLLLLISVNALVMLVFALTGAPLTTPAAPQGIVSFELAGSAAVAQAILDSWNAQAQLAAAFGLGFDYLFMLTYASAFYLASRLSGQVLQASGYPLAGISGWVGRGAWLAAAADAVENLGLYLLLVSGVNETWAQVARLAAWIKFGLLFIALVYAFYGLAIWLLQRLSRQSK